MPSTKITTQNHLDIETIRDGLVILKDGGARLIISTTAVNFDLLSEREQDAAIEAYASLLNSLNFPVQIMLRSKRMDISQYMGWLDREEIKTHEQKRKKEILEYKEYIRQIIAKNDVLDKKFFVIILFNQLTLKPKKGPIDFLLGREPKPKIAVNQKVLVKKALLELEPKRDHLLKQFNRIGINAHQLTDQEMVELFFGIYNPDIARFQKIGSVEDREALMVEGNKG